MRYLITALDIAGAGLLVSGLVLLAWLAQPFLAIAVAGALLLLISLAWETRQKSRLSVPRNIPRDATPRAGQ